MAIKYFIQPKGVVIGSNTNWGDPSNWSFISGGPWPGDAGVPTADDDVVIDQYSYDTQSLSRPIPLNATLHFNIGAECRDLTINTSYGCNVINTFGILIHGTLTLEGYLDGGEIYINLANVADRDFKVLGGYGLIRGVLAKNLVGHGGKRVYFDPLSCTITNCLFWMPCNDVVDDNGIHNQVCGPITRHIQTATQLQAMNDHPDDNYILDNDIDLLGFPWIPIGTYDNPFTGTLEGNNHTIKNLFYDDGTNENFAGLFGVCGSASSPDGNVYNVYEGVQVQNLFLRDFILKGQYAVGALCGYLDNMQATNVHVIGVNITVNDGFFSKFAFGGIGGDTYGGGLIPTTYTDCSVAGVTISGNDVEGLGGFIGSTTVDFGYLPSDNVFVITNCYAKNVKLNGTDSTGCKNFGGFIGFCEGVLEKCYAQGVITAVNNNSGGFLGEIDFTIIKDCYSHVNILGDTDNSVALGGFVGYSRNSIVNITNCYSSGAVTGDANSSNLGGFFGQISLSNPSEDIFTIENCYSAGLLTSVGTSNGGFFGFIGNDGGFLTFSIINCAWWTGSYSSAIGTAYDGSNNKSLTDEGYGTDENTKSLLYHKEHPVYAQV